MWVRTPACRIPQCLPNSTSAGPKPTWMWVPDSAVWRGFPAPGSGLTSNIGDTCQVPSLRIRALPRKVGRPGYEVQVVERALSSVVCFTLKEEFAPPVRSGVVNEHGKAASLDRLVVKASGIVQWETVCTVEELRFVREV